MNKKSSMIAIIIILIVVIVIAVVSVNKNKKYEREFTKSTEDLQMEQAVKSDTTTDISATIDGIKVDDTSDADLKAVDDQLKTL